MQPRVDRFRLLLLYFTLLYIRGREAQSLGSHATRQPTWKLKGEWNSQDSWIVRYCSREDAAGVERKIGDCKMKSFELNNNI